MEKESKLLIADLDGTLINTLPLFHEIMAEQGYPHLEITDYANICVDCGSCKEPEYQPEDCPITKGFSLAVGKDGAAPIKNSRAGLRAFLRDGWGLVYLSSRPQLFQSSSKKWLVEHDYPKAPVYCTGKEKRIVFEEMTKKQAGNKVLLIDDNPKALQWLAGFPDARILIMKTSYCDNTPESFLFSWDMLLEKTPAELTKRLWGQNE